MFSVVKMVYQGRTVATSTGSDINAIKVQLFNTFFHLAEPTAKKTKKPRRK